MCKGILREIDTGSNLSSREELGRMLEEPGEHFHYVQHAYCLHLQFSVRINLQSTHMEVNWSSKVALDMHGARSSKVSFDMYLSHLGWHGQLDMQGDIDILIWDGLEVEPQSVLPFQFHNNFIAYILPTIFW